MLKRLFFDPKRYDLGRVGRHKINQKLGLQISEEERILVKDDFIAAMKYLVELRKGEGMTDDIDHRAAVARGPSGSSWLINAGGDSPAPNVSSASG